MPAWLAEALDDPDPRVRIQVLETWAQHPQETLDPLTYALVDPEESVRTRAKELLEEALAHR
jgi:HEAT repeat protein